MGETSEQTQATGCRGRRYIFIYIYKVTGGGSCGFLRSPFGAPRRSTKPREEDERRPQDAEEPERVGEKSHHVPEKAEQTPADKT